LSVQFVENRAAHIRAEYDSVHFKCFKPDIYFRTHITPHGQHCISIKITCQLMLFKETLITHKGNEEYEILKLRCFENSHLWKHDLKWDNNIEIDVK
jgi:hypothetical protein